MRPIYLDHAATAPLRDEVLREMLPFLEGLSGNPSSAHRWGRAARGALEAARERLAALLGAEPREILFTRGGTEADNFAILGRSRAAPGRCVVCSAVEHRAVLASADAAEREGSPLRILPVDADGVACADALPALLEGGAAVVSVMWANNETGALQPVAMLAELCAERGVPFHTDAVQALGKVPVRVDQLPVDLLSVSAHKLGGPRGTGALFVRSGVELRPLLHGGRQEHGLRPGTEDVAGAVGLAAAAELAEAERGAESARLRELRDRLQTALGLGFPGLRVHAAAAERLPNLLNVSFPEVEAELLLPALDAGEIAASGGSACASGALRASHVLRAMGVAEEEGLRSVRFSLGSATTSGEIDRAIRLIPVLLEPLRTTCLA